MSYGFSATNDSGFLMFSDSTYNLSYAGKATYTGNQAFWANGNLYYAAPSWLYFPIGDLYYYTFNTGGADAIFLIHAPWPAFASILTAIKSGNSYTITVAGQPSGRGVASGLIPQIYCFIKTPNTSSTDYGIEIYKDTGEVAFSSNSNPLIVKAVYDVTYRASNLTVVVAPNGTLNVVNGPTNTTHITGTAPLNVVGNVQKPLVFFPNHETAARHNNQFFYAFWEIGARFNNSSKGLETCWVNMFRTFADSGTTFNRPQRSAYAFVADGADYD